MKEPLYHLEMVVLGAECLLSFQLHQRCHYNFSSEKVLSSNKCLGEKLDLKNQIVKNMHVPI